MGPMKLRLARFLNELALYIRRPLCQLGVKVDCLYIF